MAHIHENEIKCPYCDYEMSDSWEYASEESGEIECESCDKEFSYSVYTQVSYSTERIDCEGDKHDYKPVNKTVINQEAVDRWNREGFSNNRNHQPIIIWSRYCKDCDHKDYRNTELDGTCPWPESALNTEEL